MFRKRNNHTMLLSVIETAETLGCSAQYVRKLLREGRLAGQKIGDSWIINDDTLESFDRKDLRMKKNDVPDRKSKKAPKQDALNCLSFFSGAMGLDIGLEQEGINILLACETDNACRRTIVANEPGIGLIGDIRDYTVGEILEYANLRENGQVDIVVGGPPCQAFSTAGERLQRNFQPLQFGQFRLPANQGEGRHNMHQIPEPGSVPPSHPFERRGIRA